MTSTHRAAVHAWATAPAAGAGYDGDADDDRGDGVRAPLWRGGECQVVVTGEW